MAQLAIVEPQDSQVEEVQAALAQYVSEPSMQRVSEAVEGADSWEAALAALVFLAPGLTDGELATLESEFEPVLSGIDDAHASAFATAAEDATGEAVAFVGAAALIDASLDTMVAASAPIPGKARDRMEKVVTEAARDGVEFATVRLTAMIQKTEQVIGSASDAGGLQVVHRFYGEATRERAGEIGSTEYAWRTRLDDRVRPEHAAREGATFPWTDPPSDGHPGEPWGCRCNAEVIVPLPEERGMRRQESGRGARVHCGARAGSVQDGVGGSPADGCGGTPQVRQEDDGYATVFGYGLKWDAPAKIWGEWEQFRRGSFAETLQEHDQFLLIEHDYSAVPLARTGEYMAFSEDDVGLRYEAKRVAGESRRAAAFVDAVRRGILDKASIGFSWNNDYEYDSDYSDEDGLVTYTRVRRLYEVSGVKWPAHESSELEARAGANLRGAQDRGTHFRRMDREVLAFRLP